MRSTTGWRNERLGELVTFKTGKLDSNAAVANGLYPFFTCSQETLRTNTFSFDTECVLLAGNNANGIFPLKYFHGKFDAYQRTYVIRPQDAAVLTAKFLYYALRPKLSELRSFSTGAATKFLTLTILNETEIPVPPLAEQQRIAGILSAYDELIENSQRRIRILETMARALHREWFVHFRFPGHENVPRVASVLGEIPGEWQVAPFTELADVLSGGTPKTDVADFWNGEIPFFTPRDVSDSFYVQDTDKHVTQLGLSKCASELYPRDTVFITARGTVGKVAMPAAPMAMNQSCYALRGKPGVTQRFLFLMTLQQVEYLRTNVGGATFDTIVVDTFHRMNVVKPPSEIIASFVERVDALFDQADTLQRQVQNLRRTRDLLLPRLLSAQVLSRKLDEGPLRLKLPRVFELQDRLSDPRHPDAYFQNFDPSLKTNQLKLEAFQRLERLLKLLDDPGWQDLKARAADQLNTKDPIRGWQALFDTLGEAKGFVYLQKLGCTGVKFIPRPVKAKKMAKTPDLEAVQGGRIVLCEVKTINISQDEAQSRNRTYRGESIAAEVSSRVGDPFLWKVRSKIDEAVEQLDAQDPRREARRIVFTVVHFDDWVGDYQVEYFEQIDEALLRSPVSGAELVFSPATNLFNRTLSMRSATVFECA